MLAKYAYTSRSQISKSEGRVSNIADLRREAIKRKYTGIYKSPYYDPVERHERYMRERSAMGIGSKIKTPSIGLSSGSGGRSGGSKGSKKASKKRQSGAKKASVNTNANLVNMINELREESSLNTEARREATIRKIQDLRNQLKVQANKLSSLNKDSGVNVSEIRGRIQTIRENIERSGGNLQDWINKERTALENRIAAVYNKNGIAYDTSSNLDKENASKARDKEVKSRADSIYKSKSKK